MKAFLSPRHVSLAALVVTAVGLPILACGNDTENGSSSGATPNPSASATTTSTGTTSAPTSTTTTTSPTSTSTSTAPSCSDGKKNGTETDVDCGGACTATCADGKACAAGGDCTSGVCTGNVCVAAAGTCTDGTKGEAETDVDCGGGSCPACADTKACAAGTDCVSGVCDATAKTCSAPTCADGAKNGSETDVDCGGSCTTKCAESKTCAVGADCTTGNCDDATKKCVAPRCANGTKDGDETGVDCGGTCPSKCGDGSGCAVGADCVNGVCDATAHTCTAPSCTDTVKNGTEGDVDCGGTCVTKCADTKGCNVGADCTSGVCDTGTKKCAAPVCTDAKKNGTETDVDCGGTCPNKCDDTKTCAVGTDCKSGVCDAVAHTCTGVTCPNGTKDGTETDVDCGGSCSTKCAIGKGCATSSDCSKGICSAATNGSCRLPKSCNELKLAVPSSPSGVYKLDPDGDGLVAPFDAYCDMTNDGGGWTLAIKANGAQTTFGYTSALWTNTSLLNFSQADYDLNEAKLPSATSMPFTALRIEIVNGGVTRALKMDVAANALNALFNGPAQPTTFGRNTWKGLLGPTASLQPNCNAEGINIEPVASGGFWPAVRIGIVSNQENDCGSPDSWIGIGGFGAPCGPAPNTTSVGGIAGCSPDNGDRNTQAFGYIFVR